MSLPVENVQDYPRPPALERVPQRLRVVFGGETIADTERGWRVLETHHAPTYYIPRADIAPGVLQPNARVTGCEWKGKASYFDVTVGEETAKAAAWTYPEPTPRFAGIAGAVAFYAGQMDACFVGDIKVSPQDGDFYGGWITPNLTGRAKGARGTEWW